MLPIKISVIIPTYHRNDLLAKCLNCLAPGVQTMPAEEYEVIVTDDGFETTAEQIIRERYPWVQWVAGPRKGPAANRNNGAKYAQGDWLAFTDDDCLPDPQWLEAYAETIVAEPSCLVFEGRTYVDRPRQSLAETAPANESGGYLWSCNFAIKKQLFDLLKGFDEQFYTAAMEDVDLRLRLRKGGYNFPFVKSASVCHPWKTIQASKDGWKLFQGYKESTCLYLALHPEEAEQINSGYYIKLALSKFFRETLPGVIWYKGHGLQIALCQHIFNLKMAVILAKNNF